MAGSLKWFNYEANDGEIFAILADESNVEAANAVAVTPITNTTKYKVPGNLQPRKAVFQSVDGLIRRNIIITTEARLAALTGTDTIVDQTSGETLFLRRTEGEVVTLPNLADTGQLDGDAD